MEIAISTDRYK